MSETGGSVGMDYELGAGMNPTISLLKEKYRSNLDRAYVVDRNPNFLKQIGPSYARVLKIEPIEGDVNKLEIPDDSADLLYMKDVLGAETSLEGGSTTGHIGDPNVIAEQMNRKIKQGGKIIILETYAPNRAPREEVKQRYSQLGLKTVEEYVGIYDNNDTKGIVNLLKDDKIPLGMFPDRDSYALVFEKPREEAKTP